MDRITYRNLEIFRAVHDCGNMSRAAKHLGITQPAVTRQMQQLEAAADAKLFEIVSRRARLTQKGLELLELANKINAEVDTVNNKLEKATSHMEGKFYVACASAIKYQLLRLATEFMNKYPKVLIMPRIIDEPHVLADKLNGHEVDMALYFRLLDEQLNIVSQPVRVVKTYVVCHADHPLAKKKSITPQELVKLRIISPFGPESLMNFIKPFKKLKLHLTDVLPVDNIFTALMAARKNLGVTFAPDFLLEASPLGHGLSKINIEGYDFETTLYMSYAQNELQSLALKTFKEYVEANIERSFAAS